MDCEHWQVTGFLSQWNVALLEYLEQKDKLDIATCHMALGLRTHCRGTHVDAEISWMLPCWQATSLVQTGVVAGVVMRKMIGFWIQHEDLTNRTLLCGMKEQDKSQGWLWGFWNWQQLHWMDEGWMKWLQLKPEMTAGEVSWVSGWDWGQKMAFKGLRLDEMKARKGSMERRGP